MKTRWMEYDWSVISPRAVRVMRAVRPVTLLNSRTPGTEMGLVRPKI